MIFILRLSLWSVVWWSLSLLLFCQYKNYCIKFCLFFVIVVIIVFVIVIVATIIPCCWNFCVPKMWQQSRTESQALGSKEEASQAAAQAGRCGFGAVGLGSTAVYILYLKKLWETRKNHKWRVNSPHIFLAIASIYIHILCTNQTTLFIRLNHYFWWLWHYHFLTSVMFSRPLLRE